VRQKAEDYGDTVDIFVAFQRAVMIQGIVFRLFMVSRDYDLANTGSQG